MRTIRQDVDHVVQPCMQGLRLLLVEDEYLLALFLSEILESMGARVVGPVASVDDAIALIDRTPDIDAAILDVNLGGELVFPVADALAHRQVPIVFASGYGPDAIPSRFEDACLCMKPINPDVLCATLGCVCPQTGSRTQ